MTVRSMKLKMKTKTGQNSEQLRKGLWRTHVLINEGIAYYMNWLVLIRQENVGQKSKDEIRQELLRKIRERQRKNGWHGDLGTDDEICQLLRKLYELIVPSAIWLSGDAQILSRKFLSPLVDPNSVGGKGTSKAGAKPKWLKMKEENDPNWENEFKKYKAKKDEDPTVDVLKGLESYGLKPLFDLFTDLQTNIKWIPKNKKQYVRNWDRDMFQQAIERLLSWETWNRRLAEERQKLNDKIDNYYHKYLVNGDEWIKKLKQFEEKRGKELEQDAFAPKEDYLITPRQVRGWERIYEKWSKMSSNDTKEKLWKVVAEIQTKMKGEFGDPKVFDFLAEVENRNIWLGHPERLLQYAFYNNLIKKLKDSKEQATFTLPDPIKHPLWIRYDARGGNLYTYTIRTEGRKKLFVKLERLLWPSEDGWKEERDIEIPLAPSKQFFRQINLQNNEKGKQEVIFYDYSAEIRLIGTLGGAKIQFDRSHLENREENVANGNIGPVYLNVVIDLEPFQQIKNGRLQTPVGQVLKVFQAEWPKVTEYKTEELVKWMDKTTINNTIGIESITSGMRVMSIDLGQRFSAAVSIFEVVKEKPEENKLYFQIYHTNLYALHRRSFLLNLPGEKVSTNVINNRDHREKEYRAIKSHVRLLADILKLNNKANVEERHDEINKLINTLETINLDENIRVDFRKELESLKSFATKEEKEWQQELISVHRKLEPLVGQVVSRWRKDLRYRRKGIAGLSLWNIEELENTRKLLVSWSKRTRFPGVVNKIELNEKFGKKQLKHIHNVKDDRLKQLANLIVMTALGYKYDERDRKWKEAYPACQVILFEDLSRYLFSMDRSRKENSRLMKWSHRSIPRTVWMQAELFGLLVGDVYSAFSSRFHAKTGAPGIRCRTLNQEDLKEASYICKKLIEDGFINAEEIGLLRKGDLVPWPGGELFVTLANKDGNEITAIHADINAAQNLNKRFWLKNSELFRVKCRRYKNEDGKEYCFPETKSMQKRLGKGRFIKKDDNGVYIWENKDKIEIESSENMITYEDPEETENIFQTLEEAEELKGDFITLFRDPSGYFFAKEAWLPQKEFWVRVGAKLERLLRAKIVSRRMEL